MATTDRTQHRPIRRAAVAFMAGAAGTAIAGVAVQLGVQRSTTISDDMWRYPWSSSGAFVACVVCGSHCQPPISLPQ